MSATRTQPSRRVSLGILSAWENDGHFIAQGIEYQVQQGKLAVVDRSLVQAGLLGTLRHLTALDHWIGQLSGRDNLDPQTHNILRLGLCELLIMGTAPHAAVNEYVNLAGRARGLVNAVLRRADREREDLLASLAKRPPSDRHSHPAFLYQRWKEQFGEQSATKLLLWNQEPAPVYVRQNPLKPSPPLEEAQPVADAEGFFKVKALPREALAAGEVYAQDPSTRHAIALLAPKSGERILDACAAPGGKASMIAATENIDMVVADSSQSRCQQMETNMQRLGVTKIQTACIDWEIDNQPVPDSVAKGFDAILIDVPCTNTGVLRRRVEARWRLSENDFIELPKRQLDITEACLNHLRPGGRLVYSTCSIEREENEEVIDALLKRHPDLSLEETKKILPQEHGYDGAFAALIHHHPS